jgi:hypothetical protein
VDQPVVLRDGLPVAEQRRHVLLDGLADVPPGRREAHLLGPSTRL